MASPKPGSIAPVTSIDHVVLTVANVARTVEWYQRVLGMEHEVFHSKGDERHALKFGVQKINLHQSGAEFEPKAGRVMPGSEDLCFITQKSVEAVAAELHQEPDIVFEEGGEIVERTGARGKLRSIYVRDPDSNLIEYVQSPWPHVAIGRAAHEKLAGYQITPEDAWYRSGRLRQPNGELQSARSSK